MSRGASQLYVSLGDANSDGSISVRIYHKPLVLFHLARRGGDGDRWNVLAVGPAAAYRRTETRPQDRLRIAARGVSMTALRSIVLALALIGTTPAFAVQPDEMLPDPALEARARALSKELRCMVCQNQSIRRSRRAARPRPADPGARASQAGDSDTKVIDFLTARYGEFVLLKPRFSSRTAFLWLAPLIALAIGGFGAFFAFRRRSGASESVEAAEPVLTPDERARITELLGRVEK